jgi:hypothetical protein
LRGIYITAAWHLEWNAQIKKRKEEQAIEEEKRTNLFL